MTAVPKLTPAQRRALDTLANHPGSSTYDVRISNITTSPDAPSPAVSWQTADTLTDLGLAKQTGWRVYITDRGREVARALGIAR